MAENNNNQKFCCLKSGQTKKIVIILALTLALALLAYMLIASRESEQGLTTNQTENREINELKGNNLSVIEEAQRNAVKQVDKINPNEHILGNINSPVQLITYMDFDDSFSADFYDTLSEVAEIFGDEIVIAFRHFPLSIHSFGLTAALASECAAEQGKFWEMSKLIFDDKKAEEMNAEKFKQNAADLELDQEQFETCLETQTYKEKIQTQIDEAVGFNVTGTPQSFVNGEPLPGAYPLENFQGQDGSTREGIKSIIERHLEQTK